MEKSTLLKVTLLLILCTSSVIGNKLVCQEKADTVTYDKEAGAFDKPIPWDLRVYIKIPVEDDFRNLYRIQVRKNEDIYDYLSRMLAVKSKVKIPVIDSDTYKTIKTGNTSYLKVQFSGDNTFKPNKHYIIFWNRPNSTLISFFDTLQFLNNCEADSIIDDLEKNNERKYFSFNSVKRTYNTLYNNSLKSKYEELDCIRNDLATLEGEIPGIDYISLIKLFPTDTCKTCNVDCEEIIKSFKILSLANRNEDLIRGVISVADTSTKAKNYSGQIKNLSITIESLSTIYHKILINSLQQSSLSQQVKHELSNLNEFTILCKAQKKKLESYQKIHSTVIESVTKAYPNSAYVEYKAETNIFGFNSRAKARIIPDFGVIAYSSLDFKYKGMAPCIGFHINLVPINKDIRFRDYPNRTIWHFLSINTGWTLSSLKEEGKREDLFNNTSFMIGGGIKLNHALMITGGTLLFKKVDENPLVSETQISSMPYIGFSLDLDLKQFMNGLLDILK